MKICKKYVFTYFAVFKENYIFQVFYIFFTKSKNTTFLDDLLPLCHIGFFAMLTTVCLSDSEVHEEM